MGPNKKLYINKKSGQQFPRLFCILGISSVRNTYPDPELHPATWDANGAA